MKLLFVHQHLGAFGGAETNVLTTARELEARGHSTALLHFSNTGRGEATWRETFSETFHLAGADPVSSAETVLKKFAPDVVYLHNLTNLKVVEALLDSGIPTVRMVHDHELYCMRGYKYNPLTRAVCTRPASLYC